MRVDAGIEAGSVIGGNFDSLLAKVIVTGETRTEALERARRALDEMVVEGMATALPFHRAVVRDPAFTAEPFRVHTRWIETECDNDVPPFAGRGRRRRRGRRPRDDRRGRGRRQAARGHPSGRLRRGVRGGAGAGARRPAAAGAAGGKGGAGAAGGDALTSPMQGTIVKIAVAEGDTVAEGDLSWCSRR